MARLVLTEEQVHTWAQREIADRAKLALRIYRSQPLELDDPGYPFARRPEDGITQSPRASKVLPLARGARIVVQSRGAPYLEAGNGPGMIQPTGDHPLLLPLRSRQRQFKRPPTNRERLGAVVRINGRYYLRRQQVRSYKGQRLLEISAREAFGTRQIKRPSLH